MESELFSALSALDRVLDRMLLEKLLEKQLLEAQASGEIILSRVLKRKLHHLRVNLQSARLDAGKRVNLALVRLES